MSQNTFLFLFPIDPSYTSTIYYWKAGRIERQTNELLGAGGGEKKKKTLGEEEYTFTKIAGFLG